MKEHCSVEGCSNPSRKRGLCNTHYGQWRRSVAPPCSVSGCTRPSWARGLCVTHLARMSGYVQKPLDAPISLSRTVPLTTEEKKQKQREYAKRYYDKTAEKQRERVRQYRAQNLESVRAYHRARQKAKREADPIAYQTARAERRKREKLRNPFCDLIGRFGKGADEYFAKQVAKQKGRCAICRALPARSRLNQDHNHRTGTLRGALCANCNCGIGHFRDSIKILKKAILYIEQWKLAA